MMRLAFLAVVYLFIRFGLAGRLDQVSPYASYVFEVILVALTALTLRSTLRERLRVDPLIFKAGILGLVGGATAYWYLGFANIALPADLSSGETIFFLLIVAPLLEEGIFRFLLWEPAKRLLNSQAAWVITTLLFSFAHLFVKWSLPEDYHPFIHYQTVYTLVLGAGCGYFVWRRNSLSSAILLHFLFNFGFYLGFLVL